MAHSHQRKFISTLRAQLGTPYVWGGAAPGGFDCSGLVYWAARQAGIHGVPRTSQEQFRVGTPVPMNGLRPGDLVFMNYEGVGATHVGIYVGNGQILEAPHTGDVVKTLPVSAFAGHILGARRILANPGGSVQNASSFANQQIAYHAQQTSGAAAQQAGKNPALAAAALASIRPIQLPTFSPLKTANQTVNQIIQAHAQPPQSITQQVLANPQAPTPAADHSDALASQLDSIHQRLLKGQAA